MNKASVFAGADHLVASNNTFNTANSMYIHNINNRNRTTSDGVIPLTPNPSNRFTGRTEVIAKLKRHFFTNTNDVVKKRKFFLLHGMGGIGKTQICLKFLEDMSDHFSHVFWIDASSASTIIQALKGICNLPEAQSSALDGSPESALYWIGLLKENYAMVFDNADVLSPAELEGYLPPGRGGSILITSRNFAMRSLTSPENSLEVTEMEENDALELLLKASCLDPSSVEFQAEASQIVKELFCLPLAIDQAGSYIASGASTIGDYLAKYSKHRKILLSQSDFTGASKYNRTVYGTWELSYKEIQQRAKSDDPQRAKTANSAMLLLAMFAFFHFDGITEEIFFYAATQANDRNGDTEQRPALPLASSMIDHTLLQLDDTRKWDNFLFKEGIRALLSFSFIKLVSSKGLYGMHPLIHAWARDRMSSEDGQKCCLKAYVVLAGSLPERFNEQPYHFRRILVTHLRANIQHSQIIKKEMVDRYFDDAHEKFGKLLKEQGYDSEAVKYQIQVLDVRSRSLGEEHPDTIRAMGHLARTYENLGKYADAEKLETKALDLKSRLLGEEDPDTISAIGNLAVIYKHLGKVSDAEKLQIQVLGMRKRILGEEHPYTIWAMANLAATYGHQGKYSNAAKLQIQVLDLRKRLFGEEHLDTINAMGNLAVAYESLGKYTDAEKLHIEVLDMRNRILGEGHPNTIWAMANLATTYGRQGKYADAEKLHIQVLNLRTRFLGEEHPDTISAIGNLAFIYKSLGRISDTEKLQTQVLEMRKRILGKEHPYTIWAMANLAATYGRQGKYSDAEKLQIQVIDLRKRLLGEEHPGTISAMGNLAVTYGSLGRYADAEKRHIQVLDISNRILGEEHPSTIWAMDKLAAIYGRQGKYADAEKLQIQVLELRKRCLGEEHPDTISAMGNLTVIYKSLGKISDAEKLHIQILDMRKKILGEEHRYTIWAMANLAAIYGRQGRYTDAEKLQLQVLDLRKRLFGEEHPDTITAMGNLAVTYGSLGRYADAAKLQINVLAARSNGITCSN